MAIIWKRRNPPATDERIAQFEAKEQLILPESYKVFLRRMNGGLVRDSYVPYQEEGLTVKSLFFLTNIFSLGGISRDRRHLIKEAFTWWFDDQGNKIIEALFPRDFLPIGGSWSGREKLALDLANGTIHLWFTELDMIYAAPDMTTFVQEVVQSGEWNEEEEDI
jgi:hypothetical protein